MKREELIEKLQQLPHGCEIGTIFADDLRIENAIQVLTKDDKVLSCGDEKIIEEIENARHSNSEYICDYYIY